MSEGVKRIGLQETISALRKELTDSIAASHGEPLRFEIGEVMLEFNVEIEHNAELKSGIKFWVVELGGSGTTKDKSIHKITIPLKPIRQDGKPVLTGSVISPE